MDDTYDYTKISGLLNIRNTCFMNSALQLIFTCPLIVDFMIKGKFAGDELTNYQQTFMDYFRKTTSSMGPMILYRRYMTLNKCYGGLSQEDSQEFLTFLIDDLDTLLSKGVSKEEIVHGMKVDEFVRRMMVIQMSTVVRCGTCHHTSTTKMPEKMLSMSIDDCDTLGDCFKKFIGMETLSGDNKWHCDKCNAKVDAFKRVVIDNFPKYLFISLNRYSYTNDGGIRKIATKVGLPERWLFDENEYVICGIVCHVGEMNKGHYFSFVKRKDKWYFVNDTEIKETDWEFIEKCSHMVYMLLYNCI